jgi:D-3-phosphoglycerate dehydrogenase
MGIMTNKRVLVVSTSFARATSHPLRVLEEHGCEVVRIKGPHGEARMAELVPGFAAVIVGIDPVTDRVIEAGRDLRIVAKHGVGVDNIDVPACTRYEILVTNVPGANSEAVAEFAICALLAFTRNLVPAVSSMAEGRWEGSSFIGTECAGKKLGVIGLGAIGQLVAERAQALGMEVVYNDIVRNHEFERTSGVTYVEQEELLRGADAVSLHVPAIPETRNLINEHALSLMKPTASLFNFSRGEVVDEEALVEALRQRQIAGAALDVFRQEPLALDHPLRTFDNVLLTPHMAGYSREANERISTSAAEDVARVLTGRPPLNALNLQGNSLRAPIPG